MCQLGFPRATASSTCRTFRAAVAQQKYRRSLPLPIPEIKSFSRLSGDFNMFFQSRPDAERSRPVGLLPDHFRANLRPQELPPNPRVAAARHATFREENKVRPAVICVIIAQLAPVKILIPTFLTIVLPRSRLRVDASHSGIVGDAVDCQHISCRASVH